LQKSRPGNGYGQLSGTSIFIFLIHHFQQTNFSSPRPG
jgi:hypothetical protein